MGNLNPRYATRTVLDFVNLFQNNQINLEPDFQRQSVWTLTDRRKLIESVLHEFPIPSIFLYRSSNEGRLIYHVLDGKQRLESILMFQGSGRFRGERFNLRTWVDLEEQVEEWNWRRLRLKGYESRFLSYQIQTVEIEGDPSDIINLFVRINSTGKKLTGAEIRHANYFKSDFLKQARKIANKQKSYFMENRILSGGQSAG